MAKKTAAKKKPAPRTKAAPARAARKSARSKAAARPAKGRTARPAARAAVKKRVKAAVTRKKAKVAPKTVARAAAKKAPARKVAATAVAKKATAKKAPLRKVAPTKIALKSVAAKKAPIRKAPAPVLARKAAPPPPVRKAPTARPAPALDRDRRTVGEAEPPSTPSSFVSNRHASAASSGGDELRGRLASYTGTGPAITAGDVDANWEAAETVGDEAPGGDNPTPDQDVVDEIGKALGVEYDDDEELQGGDEIAARDHNRWELDPASSDDFDER